MTSGQQIQLEGMANLLPVCAQIRRGTLGLGELLVLAVRVRGDITGRLPLIYTILIMKNIFFNNFTLLYQMIAF